VRKLLLTLLILTLFISISYSQLSIKIVSPKNGEKVSGNVTIKVEVSDPTNVSKVEFYINNEKVGEVTKSPFEYILDTTLFPNGEYNVIVRAYEKTGSMIGISVNIKIENIYNDWQKIYGGSNDDVAYSIQQTKDGGYIVAGRTSSFESGYSDVYVIKLDENGNKIWEKTYGGNDWDGASSIQQTKDGGYIVAGWTGFFEAGYSDVYVIKLDAYGNESWEKTFGGSDYDTAWSIQQTKDGGYIVAGYTSSFGAGGGDVYIIKLDENGNMVWERTYGGSGYDIANSIQLTNDGGYIIAGKTGDFYSGDVYIIKLDKDGNKSWEKTYGGSGDDWARYIQQTTDGGYIVAGSTSSFGAGKSDVYVIKLDENGNKVWEKTYGGSDYDEAYSIQQTKDGGYIVAGYTRSFGAGESDIYIIKLDGNGNSVWERTYGGIKDDEAYSIQQTTDGGYIVAGYTESFGAGGADVYIIKLDANGDKVWEKTYGKSKDDGANSILQTTEGGYIVAGWTWSFGKEEDVYIIKLDANGNKVWEKTYGGSYDDEAYSIQQTKDRGYIVAGETYSFGAGGYDVYVIKLDVNGNKVWERTYGGSYWDFAYSIQQTTDGGYIVAGRTWSFGEGYWDIYIIKLDKFGNAKNNLIISIKKIEENVRSSMKTMQTALEMYATDNYGNYTDDLLDLLDYLPDNQFPKHPLTNKPYEIGINLFDPVNGGSPVKNSSDVKYQYAIVYKYDASNHTYTFIGYDSTNTKIIYIITGGGE